MLSAIWAVPPAPRFDRRPARENGATNSAARSAYIGAGSSSAERSAGTRSSPTSRRSSCLAMSSAGYGPGAGRGHEHAPVGQRLERSDPVVLAPRRGDEHPRPPQQRPVVRGCHPSRDLHAIRRSEPVGAGDDQRLVAAPRPRPCVEHVVQRASSPGCRRKPPRRRRGSGREVRSARRGRAPTRRDRARPMHPAARARGCSSRAPSASRAAAGARRCAATRHGARAGSPLRSRRATLRPVWATAARRSSSSR